MSDPKETPVVRDSSYAIIFALAVAVVLVSGLLVPLWQHAFLAAGVTAILSIVVATFKVLSKNTQDAGQHFGQVFVGGTTTVAAVFGLAMFAVAFPQEFVAELPSPNVILASVQSQPAYIGTAETFYVVSVVGLIVLPVLPFLLVFLAMDNLPKETKWIPWVMLLAAAILSAGVYYFASSPTLELLVQLLLVVVGAIVAAWVLFLCLLLEDDHMKLMHEQRLLGIGMPIFFGVANTVTIVQGFTGVLEHFEYLTPVAICGIGVCGFVVLLQLVFLTIYIPRGIHRESATHYMLAGSIALTIASVAMIAAAEFLGNVLPIPTSPPSSSPPSSARPASPVGDAASEPHSDYVPSS